MWVETFFSSHLEGCSVALSLPLRIEHLSSPSLQAFRDSGIARCARKKSKSSKQLPRKCRIYLFGGYQGAAPISVTAVSHEIL